MIRVLVAEDSVTVRELLVGILHGDPEIRVVGQAKNGAEAVELAERLKPDLITMDVHMPLLDGLEATKEIMIRVPTPIIIVSSSTSRRQVELSLNAMRAGALMALEKPDDPGSATFNGRSANFRSMVKAMAQVKVVRRWRPRVPVSPALPVPGDRLSKTPIRFVAIVASTGGPAAVQRILADLPREFPIPIAVVQHIARGFVGGLADWLDASCNLRVKVAEHGETVARHTVLLAPDDRHLAVGPGGRVVLSDAPAVNGFRPSGTHLFESAAEAYGAGLGAIILTGMGRDGVDGLAAVKAKGGYVIAQDEATSVVYGMPREAVAEGVVEALLPVEEIAARLALLVPAP